jgi:DNA-binding MarR family transcriptional regulator
MANPCRTSSPPADAFVLAQQIRAFLGKLKRQLRAQSDAGDLTPSQTAVLLRLEVDGPATTSALARAEGIRPQSMGTVMAAIEAAGFVVGIPDPSDGRQTLFSVTEQFRLWFIEGRAARLDWLSQTISTRLSLDEQARLAAVMPLLHRLIEE